VEARTQNQGLTGGCGWREMGDDSVLMHMHTRSCKHACGEPKDYPGVAQQREKGLSSAAVVRRLMGGLSTSGWAWLDDYIALVGRGRGAWVDRVDIRPGVGSDHAPGPAPHRVQDATATLRSSSASRFGKPQGLHRNEPGEGNALNEVCERDIPGVLGAGEEGEVVDVIAKAAVIIGLTCRFRQDTLGGA